MARQIGPPIAFVRTLPLTAESLIENRKGDHDLGSKPLQSVEPTWPTIQYASLKKQNIRQNEKWHRPGHAA